MKILILLMIAISSYTYSQHMQIYPIDSILIPYVEEIEHTYCSQENSTLEHYKENVVEFKLKLQYMDSNNKTMYIYFLTEENTYCYPTIILYKRKGIWYTNRCPRRDIYSDEENNIMLEIFKKSLKYLHIFKKTNPNYSEKLINR